MFKATGPNLWIRALGADRRPTEKTQLYLTPYWNCYDNGSVCAGTMKIPRQTSIDAIAGALGPICQPTRHRLPRYEQHDKSMLSKECPSDHNCTFLRMLTPTEMNNPPAHRCQTLVMTLGI